MQTSKLRTDRATVDTAHHDFEASNASSSNGKSSASPSTSTEVIELIDRAYRDLLSVSKRLPAGGELHYQMLRGIRAVQIVHDSLTAEPFSSERPSRRSSKR